MDLKKIYGKDINIRKYFHNEIKDSDTNTIALVSYDYQAGSYSSNYNKNEIVRNTYLYLGKPIDLKSSEYTKIAAESIANEIRNLEFSSMLEVGVGESTTICDLLLNLPKDKKKWVGGIDLSLSRLLYARKFEEQKQVDNINHAVGNMFNLPFSDNSVDLCFTYYCVHEHRGKEEQSINELLRVARKYVVMIEPSYELGNSETKKRIDELCYVKDMEKVFERLNASVIKYRLFDIYTYNNNAAIIILKKKDTCCEDYKSVNYSCPICKKKLVDYKGNFYCNECFNIYPIINNIPVLTVDNAILCSKYKEF